jgi:hypothetical protein
MVLMAEKVLPLVNAGIARPSAASKDELKLTLSEGRTGKMECSGSGSVRA